MEEITINEVRKLIKDFTKKTPQDEYTEDPMYREYLAKCAELLELDFNLTTLENFDKDEYFYIKLKEIYENVQKITSSKI